MEVFLFFSVQLVSTQSLIGSNCLVFFFFLIILYVFSEKLVE